MQSMRTLITTLVTAALVALLAATVAAQDDDEVMSSTVPDPAPAMADVLAVADLTLVDSTGAGDALVGASTPSAAAVELRLTAVDDEGVISSVAVDTITVPPGGEMLLKPDGYHLELVDPMPALTAGDQIEVTLDLEVAGSIPVTARLVAFDTAALAEGPSDTGTLAATAAPVADLPTSISVEALDNFFIPRTIELPANTEVKVTLKNYGFLPHNIAFYTDDTASQLLADGSLTPVIDPETEAIARFTTPGPGEYFILCVIHPEMTGVLTVR